MAGRTDLIGLPKAVDPPHFPLLVRIGEDAHGRLLSSDAQDEILAALLSDVLAKFAQQPAGPLLFHLRFLVLEKNKKSNIVVV